MAQEKITFAVIPFQSQQSFGLDQQSLAALGGGIAQILATELSLSPGGTATPRSATSQAITSQQLPKADRIDAETAAKVGAMVGARYVIMGNFVDYYGKFRLNARVIEVATGSIVKGFTNDDPAMQDREKLYQIIQLIARRILTDLKLPPPVDVAAQVPSAAVIAYSLGLQAEDAGDKTGAAALYGRALQSAPQFPEAQEGMQRTK